MKAHPLTATRPVTSMSCWWCVHSRRAGTRHFCLPLSPRTNSLTHSVRREHPVSCYPVFRCLTYCRYLFPPSFNTVSAISGPRLHFVRPLSFSGSRAANNRNAHSFCSLKQNACSAFSTFPANQPPVSAIHPQTQQQKIVGRHKRRIHRPCSTYSTTRQKPVHT